MKPHKHAELIKAWADGAEIECLEDDGSWIPVTNPIWRKEWEYRIKPKSKPDLDAFISCNGKNKYFYSVLTPESANLRLTFDGETGELKSAEVLK